MQFIPIFYCVKLLTNFVYLKCKSYTFLYRIMVRADRHAQSVPDNQMIWMSTYMTWTLTFVLIFFFRKSFVDILFICIPNFIAFDNQNIRHSLLVLKMGIKTDSLEKLPFFSLLFPSIAFAINRPTMRVGCYFCIEMTSKMPVIMCCANSNFYFPRLQPILIIRCIVLKYLLTNGLHICT